MNLSDISVVLNLIFSDVLSDQFRRDVLLPNLLAVEPDRNKTCTWGVKFSDRATAGPKAEGYDAADEDFDAHIRKDASLSWAQYFAWAKVSGLAQSVAGVSGGAVSSDLLEEEVIDAVDELAVKLSQHTYAGNGSASPTEIEGLARAVDATGTYAGLAQGTYAEWASGEQTLAAASLSLDNLRTKLHRTFKDNAGAWPEFVVCPGAQWDAVSALFNDNQRQIVEVVNTAARGEVKLKAIGGYRAIVVDGIPYIEDRHCTANTFYALHSKWLSYRQVPSAESSMHPSAVQRIVKELTGQTLEMDEIAEMLKRGDRRLQPTIECLSKTGDNMKCMVKLYAQLRLKRRGGASKLLLT